MKLNWIIIGLIGLFFINKGHCVVLESGAFVAEATEIIGVVRIGVSLVDYIYKVFANILRDSGAADKVIDVSKDKDVEKRLLTEYKAISSALERLGHGYESVENSIQRMIEEFPNVLRRELKLDKVDTEIRTIWNFYNTLETYQENKDKLEEKTLKDFAHNIISHHGSSIKSRLDNLHSLVVPKGGILDNEGVISMFAKGIDDGKHLCSLGHSPHQIIYNLYNVIALTEIKGYAMIQFAYMIMRLHGEGNFTTESELARKTFESQATEKLMAVKAILPKMSRNFWQCDPDQHVEGETFVRLTNLLQGHIENEIDLNGQASCRKSCEPYNFAQPKSCYKDLFCAKQPSCQGRLFDCGFYDADAWVCLSENHGLRKYDWIEYEDGTRLGRKTQCPNQIKVDSWWRWLFWHCSYCFCKCDAPGPNSDRYWSLKDVVSDIDSNKVITGVRFVKKNRVIQVEIEQSTAFPEGSINDTDRSWTEAENLDIQDKANVYEMFYENRALDLDILEAPPGHVITGVRFRKLGVHLNLEARITPINFKNGTLNPSLSTWIGQDKTQESEDRRTRVGLISPDIPTRYLGKNGLDSVPNQFVMFDATSASKDAAQTTIPYIDAQEVKPSSGVWLTGIGLYHKGRIGYGGFVGFMVQTLDFSSHLLPELQVESESSGPSTPARLIQNENFKYDFTLHDNL